MNRFSKGILVTFILLLSIGCDQTVKSIARSSLASASSLNFFGGIVHLEYAENPGAFLSLGADLPASIRFFLFIVIAGMALIGTLVYALRTRRGSILQLLGLSFIAAGGLGNIIDRVRNDGSVVDFVSISVGPLQTGIFNLADVAVTTGLVLILLSLVKDRRSEPSVS